MMKKNKIVLNPKYNKFLIRIWFNTKIYFFLSAPLPLVTYIINGADSTAFIVGGIIFIGVTGAALFYAYLYNKYCLAKLVISPNENRVYYYLNKFDNIYKKEEIELNKFDVEVKQIFFTKAPQYKLILYYNNKEFFVQREAGVWTAQHFKKVLEYIRKLQGRPAYTNYIRDQWF